MTMYTSVIMGSVDPRETGEASAMVAVMRQTGMMVSMGTAMLFISLIIGLLSLAPQQRWPIAECWEALAGCVIGGALMTGFLMLAARVNLIFRLGAAVLLVGVLGGVFHEVLKAESWWIWPLLLTNAAIALLLLVEFARRGYASPSENTTRMVQLLTLTPNK